MQSAKFTTTVSGIGEENFTYQWQHNGEDMSGETGDSFHLDNVTEIEGGLYQCIVKNQYGDSCMCSAELIVTSEKMTPSLLHKLSAECTLYIIMCSNFLKFIRYQCIYVTKNRQLVVIPQ